MNSHAQIGADKGRGEGLRGTIPPMLKKPSETGARRLLSCVSSPMGCAKNEVDSEEIAGSCNRRGIGWMGMPENPDVVIINTCGFIEPAKREGLQVIQHALQEKRAGRVGRVIVAGCLVQREGETLRQMFPDVDAFVGVGQMARFAEIVGTVRRQHTTPDRHPTPPPLGGGHGRLRSRTPWSAYLKISEGCDHKCTFTIPSFRGRTVLSKPLERVLQEAEWLAQNGAKQINLIAQDTTPVRRLRPLQAVLCSPPRWKEAGASGVGLSGSAFTTLTPSRITDALIETMARSHAESCALSGCALRQALTARFYARCAVRAIGADPI